MYKYTLCNDYAVVAKSIMIQMLEMKTLSDHMFIKLYNYIYANYNKLNNLHNNKLKKLLQLYSKRCIIIKSGQN